MSAATGHDKIAQAAAELDRQQQELRSVSKKLAGEVTKVTSTDKMVTVQLDARGEVASITFNTQSYRRVAPAELAANLVETIKRARAQSRDRMVGAYRSLLPTGFGLDGLFDGNQDLDAVFDRARRQARELLDGQR
jgi:DNA-binding protein YbaB